MITIKNKNNTISIKGHAFYNDHGTDIVCASVSSIVITTINAIDSIDKKAIKHNYKNEVLTINILKFDEITNKLIQNMLNMLKGLELDYKDNIKLV